MMKREKQSQKWLTFFVIKILKTLWYLIVVVLILLALMVTTARLITPLLNQHKQVFEKWTSQFLDMPVNIGHLQAWWNGFQPDIKLENIVVFDKKQKKEFIHIREIEVDVNFFRSLWHRSILPSCIEITGVQFNIQQLAGRYFQMNSINKEENKNIQKEIGALHLEKSMDWLLNQPVLILRDIRIDEGNNQNDFFPLIIHQVTLNNSGNRHFLYGTITFLHHVSTSFEGGALLRGDLHDVSHLKATAYGDVKNIILSEWQIKPAFQGYQINQAQADGQIWLTWQNDRWSLIQTLLDVNHLELLNKKTSQTVNVKHISGHFVWQSQFPFEWTLSADHVGLTIQNYQWPENSFSLHVKENSEMPQQQLYIDHLYLKDVSQFLLSMPQLDKKIQFLLNTSHLRGKLEHLYFEHQGWIYSPHFKIQNCVDTPSHFSLRLNDYHFTTQFDNLSFNRMGKIPGVENLSGYLDIQPDEGNVILDSKNTQLNFGSLFTEPLSFDVLSGQVSWSKSNHHLWSFFGKDLIAINSTLAVYGKGTLLFNSTHKTPFMSLLMGFDCNDSSKVRAYFPVSILNKNLMTWLSQAFVKGKGATGTFILHGNMRQFPFDRHQGTFVIDSQIKDTQFQYASNWPTIDHLSGHLIFDRRAMSFEAEEGEISKAALYQVKGNIPYIGDKKPVLLHVSGAIESDADQLIQFTFHSPLRNSIGNELAPFHLNGISHLGLDLNIPIEHPEKTKLQGHLKFDDVQVSLPAWKLTGQHLKGDILFSEKNVSSSGMSLLLFDEPALLNFKTVHHKNQLPFLQVQMQSHINLENLVKEFSGMQFLQTYITGETDYRAQVDWRTAKQDLRQNVIQVYSNLKGITIQLPEPLNKSAFQKVPFSMHLWMGNQQPIQLAAQISKILNVMMLFKSQGHEMHWYSAHVHVGPQPAKVQEEKGLYIDGYLPQFDWSSWHKQLMSFKSQGGASSDQTIRNWMRKDLRALDFTVGKIEFLQQKIKQLHFKMKPDMDGWKTSFESETISGTLFIPDQFPKESLKGYFNQLIIIPSKSMETSRMNPGQIPPMQLDIKHFRYGNRQFQNIVLNMHPQKNELVITRLQFNSDLLMGTLKGAWSLLSNNQYQSELSGSLKSRQIPRLFEMLDMKTSLVAEEGNADFDLSWPDKIYQGKLENMDGHIALNFGRGRIIGLSEETKEKLNIGRILSVLSIDRILEMNFSDLAESGYGFNSMKGNFILSKGLISTQNLFFDGSVAKIAASGMINLIQKSLNLKLSVTADVTSSLPVVAAVAINPAVGVAAWVGQKIFSKELGKFTTYYYQVTGNWDKPIVKKIE